jgi:hypothetical protein
MKKKIFLLLIAITGLTASTYSQSVIVEGKKSVIVKSSTSEAKLFADFITKTEQSKKKYSPEILKFIRDQEKDLKVNMVIIKYPKKWGGASIGYYLTPEEREKLRKKEEESRLTEDQLYWRKVLEDRKRNTDLRKRRLQLDRERELQKQGVVEN